MYLSLCHISSVLCPLSWPKLFRGYSVWISDHNASIICSWQRIQTRPICSIKKKQKNVPKEEIFGQSENYLSIATFYYHRLDSILFEIIYFCHHPAKIVSFDVFASNQIFLVMSKLFKTLSIFVLHFVWYVDPAIWITVECCRKSVLPICEIKSLNSNVKYNNSVMMLPI